MRKHRVGAVSRRSKLDDFTLAYIEAVLWQSTDTDPRNPDAGEQRLDKNHDMDDIDDITFDQMVADCAEFQQNNEPDLDLIDTSGGCDSENAGGCFWLSRARSGSGFCDRSSNDEDMRLTFERLENAAKAYGNFELYIGDDGKIYAVGYEPAVSQAQTSPVASVGGPHAVCAGSGFCHVYSTDSRQTNCHGTGVVP